ncbi:hypothetical protein [Rurimicrobium arvi]|uniref:Tetratricopeptide repeat protein n=1 Tax=Rurimicrobium arvi TaxID=2049916 RepID=A0ABP8MU74_9BACT
MTVENEHIRFITEWLDQPRALNEKESVLLAGLLQQYPFLMPLRVMELSQQMKQEQVADESFANSLLFAGNWVQFHSLLTEALMRPAQQESDEAGVVVEVQTIDAEPEIVSEPFAVAQGAEDTIPLIQPLFTENYFQHQGIDVADTIPESMEESETETSSDGKSLLVMMQFEDWLQFLKRKSEVKRSEEEDRAMLRSIWQREKLAAAVGEEDDNIPEAVFEMAISSIDKQDLLVSEPLAEIHIRQGHYEKAIEIYRKLSLQNPEKKTYFADKINTLTKDHSI